MFTTQCCLTAQKMFVFYADFLMLTLALAQSKFTDYETKAVLEDPITERFNQTTKRASGKTLIKLDLRFGPNLCWTEKIFRVWAPGWCSNYKRNI